MLKLILASWRTIVAVLLVVGLVGYMGNYYRLSRVTQADLEEISGIVNAVLAEYQIPESTYYKGQPSIFGTIKVKGLSLTRCNAIAIYGVTNENTHHWIVDTLRRYYTKNKTKPILVTFYKSENWVGTQKGAKHGSEELISSSLIPATPK